MSALGQKRTFSEVCVMSALPPNAAIRTGPGCVRRNSSVSFVTLAISGRRPDGRPAGDHLALLAAGSVYLQRGQTVKVPSTISSLTDGAGVTVLRTSAM